MKVAYLTQYDARDINRWSGTGYYMGEALQAAGLDLDYLGPLGEVGQWLVKAKKQFYTRLTRRAYLGEVEPIRTRGFAREAARKLAAGAGDLVLSPHTLPIAWLETARPVVLWADCTFAGMVDFYPYYCNLCRASLRHGHETEQAALDRCRLAIFASEWAAQTARQHYHTDPAKIRVVPYGANIVCRRTQADIEKLVAARPPQPCKLLFIGRIWKRKGGEVALAVAQELNRAGLPTQLTLVGSLPENPGALPDFVRPLGFIDKATAEGRQRLDALFAESHFLIVPSRAEAFGIVFCEASSFAVPSLASQSGGIPSVVRDNYNGRTFPLDAPPGHFVQYVLGLMGDYSQYQQLARRAFAEYTTRLNWHTAAQTVNSLLSILNTL